MSDVGKKVEYARVNDVDEHPPVGWTHKDGFSTYVQRVEKMSIGQVVETLSKP